MVRRATLLFIALSLFTLGLAAAAGAGTGAGKPQSLHRAPLPAGSAMVSEPVFGGKAYIREAGIGNPFSVVLVHGLGDLASGTWDSLLPVLAETYHVVTFDLPGFGRSEKRNALYSPEKYAAFVDWVVDRYVPGPFALAGHSLGGAVALRFAASHPENLRKLILVDAAGILHRAAITKNFLDPHLRDRWSSLPGAPLQTVDDLVAALIEDLQNLPLDLDMILESGLLRGKLLGGDPVKIAALALVQDNLGPSIAAVSAPTLVLWGAEDPVTPLRTAAVLETRLPEARLQLIPGAGHVPMFEQPALFARAVTDFLRSPSLAPRKGPPTPSERIGRCKNREGMSFTGAYSRIEISGCSDVLLSDVVARSVDIEDSRVTIERAVIGGEDVALSVRDSLVTATAVTLEAKEALLASNSRIDLAGGKLLGKKTAARSDDRSTLLFSVTLVESPLTSGYLHGVREISPKAPL